MAADKKLKDPRVLRIFASSPFNGMEGEREALTKLYWPRIQSLCSSRGLHFRVVDMRWGITSESSDDAQTINICLRELDRSDIFVGFFGQRYGWHGAEDLALQKNMENGIERYPWVSDYRDRSVTELEYLHGYLNDPGAMPACIGFRDKAYDDAEREKGVAAGDKRTIYKFSSESDVATTRMNDLKRRVKDTEDKSIGVNMAYATPQEGARFLFDCVWNYITTKLFTTPPGVGQSKRLEDLANHDAYITQRLSLYIGGEKNYDILNAFLKSAQKRFMLITGPAGSGKSALLSNWLRTRPPHSDEVLVYHFIGCASGTTDLISMLRRIRRELLFSVSEVEEGEDGGKKEQPAAGEVAGDRSAGQQQAIREFHAVLARCEKYDKAFTIIIDGLSKMDPLSKVGKPLHWLPSKVPANVRVVITSSTSDEANVEAFKERERIRLVAIEALSLAERKQLCLSMLVENSKELSPDQLEMVVNCSGTNNPLFLKIIIEELCVFGQFRKLTSKIEGLIASESVVELFGKVLQRLEEDYDSGEGMIQQVMCSVCLSRNGISETQLTEMWQISQQAWSPLFFAVEKYLVSRLGQYCIAYSELSEAVTARYLQDVDYRSHVLKTMADHYYNLLQKELESTSAQTLGLIRDTVYVLNEIDDQTRLLDVLTNLRAFQTLYNDDMLSVLPYLNSLNITNERLAQKYLRAVDKAICDAYVHRFTQWIEPTPVPLNVFECLHQVQSLLEAGSFYRGEELVIERLGRMLNYVDGMSEEYRSSMDINIRRMRAINKCHLEKFVEACQEHQAVIDILEGKELSIELPNAYHGLACALHGQEKNDEAMSYFRKAVDVFDTLSEKQDVRINKLRSQTTIALLHFTAARYDQAIKLYEQIIKEEEEYFFGRQPPELSYTILNLGLCYRHLGQLDKAAQLYKQSLDIKVNAMGWKTPDVAMSLLNMGVLEMHRGNEDKCLEYYQQSLQILEETLPDDHSMLLKARENFAGGLIGSEKEEDHKRAAEIFWKAFERRVSDESMEGMIAFLYRKMMQYHLERGEYQQVTRILAEFLPTSHAEPRDYLALDKLDNQLPPEERPRRPPHLSIDHAIERWPTEKSLWGYKMTNSLIPAADTEGMLRVLTRYMRACQKESPDDPQAGSDAFIETGDHMLQNNLHQMAIPLLEEGEKHLPTCSSLGKPAVMVKGEPLLWLSKEHRKRLKEIKELRISCLLKSDQRHEAIRVIDDNTDIWQTSPELVEKMQKLKLQLEAIDS